MRRAYGDSIHAANAAAGLSVKGRNRRIATALRSGAKPRRDESASVSERPPERRRARGHPRLSMTKLGNDFRQALRVAAHQKFVRLMAIVAFALGIGVTTAVFSIFNGVLLAPLPFPEPEQLVMVYDTQPACATCPASFPKYYDWKERNQVFSAIGGSTGLVRDDRPGRSRTDASARDDGVVERCVPRAAAARTLVLRGGGPPGGPKVVVLSLRVLDAAASAAIALFSDAR